MSMRPARIHRVRKCGRQQPVGPEYDAFPSELPPLPLSAEEDEAGLDDDRGGPAQVAAEEDRSARPEGAERLSGLPSPSGRGAGGEGGSRSSVAKGGQIGTDAPHPGPLPEGEGDPFAPFRIASECGGEVPAKLRHLKVAAERGHLEAAYLLAQECVDRVARIHWLTLAAERGHVPAMHDLGLASAALHERRRWLLRAAQHGWSEAMAELGDVECS